MFWRSVVGKLAITILLLVSFVLFILTILLLEFFETFHVNEAENEMMQTATKVSQIIEQYDDQKLALQNAELVKDPVSRIAIIYGDGTFQISDSTDEDLNELSTEWLQNDEELMDVFTNGHNVKKETTLPNSTVEAMIVGTPVNQDGAVFIYQSLDIVNQTKAETTKIILLAAGIAIILTTIFAFFLSTRITSPLIKMREAALDLTRGEFNTKVPILTHDEIGELAIAFNRMGRQLKFHINALRQEKEQISSIVSSMADGVITLNRNGDMLVTNPPAEQFIKHLYYEKDMEQNEDNLSAPAPLNEILRSVINDEKEVIREMNTQGRTWVMIMTPLYDQTYVRGAVAVIRDMTEERKLDKMRKDFIANVSHELRTPISMLQGYSEAIVDDVAESKEEKNELAQIIHEESFRMGRLVNELLDLARMEAGHTRLNKEHVDADSFVERIIKKFKGLAEENHVQLMSEKQLTVSNILIDTDRMEQVFTNLIDNAIRHTKENGYVKVVVKSTETNFHISIEDNGSGIPEEDIPFVFERFYKADKSRTRGDKKKGTGLGLAIAKNIVEAHDGTINVKSKVDEGTTFDIKIPL
ncbi:two-component system, OmpR family, sensor histidine kinase ResE [Lentibacillus halodurans]|uniref:histidine kinase n=1 Tax=Lentibacillus halodurans TaxID=237679 RepID=A0A1I0VAY4_9BACI|nr:ATP-binding protein [Lentibacillus halodurans]SFA73170.1 two-component system, OmpR family, sensor histidine kinase ResE [Lentibacillus halodurans]